MSAERIEALYEAHCAGGWAIASHLPRLRALASGCDVAVEFGVKRGASSSALLTGLGEAGRLVSYDILETDEARELAELAGERWDYRISDSRIALPIGCDLLFIDSLHTYAQCRVELERHADRVRRLLVFHDSITFGSIGADGETGRHLWDYSRHVGESVPQEALGIRPAIDELMLRDPSWQIAAHYTDAHGLLVLERRGGR